MKNNFWDEVFQLVAEYDNQRPCIVIENRLYYNTDGTIIGYHETNHPVGENYIVLEDPNIFFKNNTNLLRVKDKKLVVIDVKQPTKARLKKSTKGLATVKGHASLLLENNETYDMIEFYEYTNY